MAIRRMSREVSMRPPTGYKGSEHDLQRAVVSLFAMIHTFQVRSGTVAPLTSSHYCVSS